MSIMRNRWRKRSLVAVIALCLLILLISANYNSTISEYVRPKPSSSYMPSSPSKLSLRPVSPSRASHSSEPKYASSDVCEGYIADADVAIIVKTGATEASRKLPVQLLSFLSCAKDDVFFFSDMEQYIGDIHVYDSLDDVVEEARFNNTEFTIYEDQKQYVIEGGDVGSLSKRLSEAWLLDKYKNIHTALKVWKLQPNKSWYFFIDADTYIVWSSLFLWLKQLDATKKLYVGAEFSYEDIRIAHGGSGYLLSRSALEVLVSKDFARESDISVKDICCGDIQLGKLLRGINIDLTNVYPIINGWMPRKYLFGPKLWCQPVVTMHHMNAEDMNDIWQFERSRKDPMKPLLFEELFTAHLEHKFPARSTDWDDLPEDLKNTRFPAEREDWITLSQDFIYEPPKNDNASLVDPHWDAFKSLDKCIEACKGKAECFQYVYSDQKCALSKSFSLGQRKAPQGQTRWKAGWDLDKIEKFKRENSPCKSVDYSTYENTVIDHTF